MAKQIDGRIQRLSANWGVTLRLHEKGTLRSLWAMRMEEEPFEFVAQQGSMFDEYGGVGRQVVREIVTGSFRRHAEKNRPGK